MPPAAPHVCAGVDPPTQSVHEASAFGRARPGASTPDGVEIAVYSAPVMPDQTRLDLPPPTVVALRGVTKRFGERIAVDGLDLDVTRGHCVGLLGPNGAGKTTALRMIYGVVQPTAGSVRVFGLEVSQHAREVRARLGVTLQQNVLIEALSVEENLRVFARYHGLREGIVRQRARDLIDELELTSHASTPARLLSGGMARRLAIGMSLVNRPELLILDEPTTGLDPQVRLALWARIRGWRSSGTTVLLTTHYMDEAERLCDRLAIVARGRLCAEGTPAGLVTRYLAREALELEVDDADAAWVMQSLAPGAPAHRNSDRLVVFAPDVGPWLEAVRRRDGGDRRTVIVRPANVEDVFLALTGDRLGDTEA